MINLLIEIYPNCLSPRWLKIVKVKNEVNWYRKNLNWDAILLMLVAKVESKKLGLK